LHTHYCHSSAKIASEILTSWNSWRYKVTNIVDCPVYKKKRARLEKVLCRFDGKNVVITTEPRKNVYIPMEIHEFASGIISEFGVENCGEITISIDNKRRKIVAFLPLKRMVDLKEPCSFMPIDINERSIDYATVSADALELHSVDTSDVSTTHYTYSLKRRRVQESIDNKAPIRVQKRKELLFRYGTRERNKTKDFLHKLTNDLVDSVKKENPIIVMENLKDIRKSSSREKNLKPWQPLRSKGLRRRLNRWNFGMFQQLLTYKVSATGNAVVKVSARNTSRKCIKCGKNTKCESSTYTCQYCGFTMNRHLLASINILDKYLAEKGKEGRGIKHVASTVPAESDQMNLVVGAFRERVESINGDRNDVMTSDGVLSNVVTL
jgi:IS605 OrfB family transposase